MSEPIYQVQIEDEGPPAQRTKNGKVRGTIARNPTVVAIARISSILDALDETTRDGVVRFIASQYC